jgi:tetratricopeptide (TPR) repeat protein
MSDVWELVKSGDYDRAVRAADEEFKQTSSVLALRNKVFALLQLRRYDDAANLCSDIIELRQGENDADFIFLGVSYWLRGRVDPAIASWRAASNTKYTDAAGGVGLWLLLFFAAIKLNDSSLRQESEARLSAFCKESEIDNWPGPIARYVLGHIGETELLSATSSQPILKSKQLCQSEFYIGVLAMANNNRSHMIHMTKSISQGVVCFVKPEYYLAEAEIRERELIPSR